jgi:hypothetical protein
MDWKEGAKWFVVIVAASGVSAVITMVLENHFKGTARNEARAEVDRVMSAAVERFQTQLTQQNAIARKQPSFAVPIKESGTSVIIG